jgi:hypothetical protein
MLELYVFGNLAQIAAGIEALKLSRSADRAPTA